MPRNTHFLNFLAFCAVASAYVVEVVVVVDKPAQAKWVSLSGSNAKMKEEIRATFLGISETYKSIDMEVRLKKVICTRDTVAITDDGPQLLALFKIWLQLRNIRHYDHAMLLTAQDIQKNRFRKVRGIARPGAICTPESLSVLEVTGDYRVVVNGAHEIGHSLGMRHDGDPPSSSSCNPSEEYVMSPQKYDARKRNKWFFSSCSSESAFNKISTLNPNCLTKTTSDAIDARRLGELIGSADALCQRSYSNIMARQGMSSGYGSDICTGVPCVYSWKITGTKTTTRIRWIDAPDGMLCGRGKRCLKGNCVSSYGANNISDSCPFGDSPYVVSANFKSCQEVAKDQRNCNNFYKRVCCQSCA